MRSLAPSNASRRRQAATATAMAMSVATAVAVAVAPSLAEPVLAPQPTVAAPFLPRSGAEVLETLPRRGDAPQAALRHLRAQLAAAPRNTPLAVTLAQRYIELGRAEGDPRYFGYAQAALAPWWHETAPPVQVLLLRATLLQSNHRFDEAIRDLEAIAGTDPGNAQAWLTLATVQVVRGEYSEAVRSCARLSSLTSQLVSMTCLANARAANGQLAASERLLALAVTRSDAGPGAGAGAGPGVRAGNGVGGGTDTGPAGMCLWSLTLLGELAARRGDGAGAEKRFRQALAIAPGDSYLLGAYADLMLDQGRHADVRTLLREHLRNDGLLLRHTLAASQAASASPAVVAGVVAELQARFDAAQQRGESIHGREQARFELHLRRDPRTALRLALANWQVQKETADLRILLEAALAAGDPAAAHDALAWRRLHGFEDAVVDALASKLEGG